MKIYQQQGAQLEDSNRGTDFFLEKFEKLIVSLSMIQPSENTLVILIIMTVVAKFMNLLDW